VEVEEVEGVLHGIEAELISNVNMSKEPYTSTQKNPT